MAVLNQCCCGCSLKTGAIIIAVLYLVYSLIQLATTANNLHNHQYIDDSWNDAVDNINKLVQPDFDKHLRSAADSFDNTFGNTGKETSLINALDKAAVSNKTQVTKTQLIVTLVFAVIQALCGILLLFGAIQEKAGMLLPWVIVESLVIAATTVMYIIICVVLFAVAETVVAGFIVLGIMILSLLLSIYFLLVVYSYYQTLRENPRRYV